MFASALPVWKKEQKLNDNLVFIGEVAVLLSAKILITASTFYRLSVNGKFVAFGPSRTAYGYARVDEISLDGLLSGDKNEIMIEVAGYNCRSLSTCFQPSFLCAELIANDESVLYTGKDFRCYENNQRERKVMRYSMQRHFSEVYDFSKDFLGEEVFVSPLKTAPKYIPRVVPYPNYELKSATLYGVGKIVEDANDVTNNRYSFTQDDKYWGVFDDSEVVSKPMYWAQKLDFSDCETKKDKLVLAGEYALFDFHKIETGFIRLSLVAKEDCRIVICWTELGNERSFAFTDMNAHNTIELFIRKGEEKSFSSFEPYTAKKIAVIVKEGSAKINAVTLLTYERTTKDIIKHEINDEKLKSIYDAGVRTFVQNAVDIFTDCPSRERAGWLCDTFFTARTEFFLFGSTLVEDAFLENYRLFENHEKLLPDGVLPMCYPSDMHFVHGEGYRFIPQWDMWYAIEVYEYLTERNPSANKEAFRKSVYGIVDFLAKYENEFSLLENIDGWNFVEWSKANDWTKNINYPTNFLYSHFLDCVGSLYDDQKLIEKANIVRKKTRELSFNGEIFIDNAVRLSDGSLENTNNCSEACQYYALLFGGISLDDEKYAFLKKQVYEKFLSFDNGKYNYTPINAFIGAYLRIIFLIKYGDGNLLKDDLIYLFGDMVKETSTLWEYRKRGVGSQNHGFASLACLAVVEAERLISKN